MQTRKGSLIEIVSGTVVAMVTAMVTQLIAFPLFNIEVTFDKNIYLLLIFTGVSMVRSYIWRRFFNYLKVKGVIN